MTIQTTLGAPLGALRTAGSAFLSHKRWSTRTLDPMNTTLIASAFANARLNPAAPDAGAPRRARLQMTWKAMETTRIAAALTATTRIVPSRPLISDTLTIQRGPVR